MMFPEATSMPKQASAANVQSRREAYYDRIKGLNLKPLWEELHALVPREPASPCVAALWRFAEIRPYLMESADLITAEEAVRRVLVLENPGLPGRSSITQSLYAGLQLIMPREVAPAHRHVQSALRFIVDGQGAYTTVNGERTTMFPGDFIITPSWAWHDHGNEGLHGGSEPVVWLDGLDIPLVRFFDSGFAEDSTRATRDVAHPEGYSYARYGHNMAPVRHAHTSATSPLFSYPYTRSREALTTLQGAEAPNDWHGWKLAYINPLTGKSAIPTMATYLQLLPAGFRTRGYQTTSGTIYSVVEGHGTAQIAGQRHNFAPRDTFVVPSWAPLSLETEDEAVLFSYSDRPVQEAIGIHRETFLDH
jgi:gentisate 1,2-dioxygenase